ncbi:MAG TPA: hypothetical protein VHT50_09650 [Mycobacterium sp.]|nr:hypothetical protein [Mycobacterium sp.]
MKGIWRISASYLAYILLLMGFVSLGLFVAALATGSILAGVLAAVLIACLAGSVAGFRATARELARSRPGIEQASAVSIFSTPLRQEQVDRYLENHRGDTGRPQRRMTVLNGGESTERVVPSESGQKRIPAQTDALGRLSA